METDFSRWLETTVRRNRIRLIVQIALLSAAAVAASWVVASSQLVAGWAAGLLWIAGAVLAIASTVAIWAGRARGGYTLSSAARHYDDQLGLQHRLTSALELRHRGPREGLLSGALLEDANQHVKGLDPSRLAPVADRFTLGAALGSALIAVSLMLWPAPPPTDLRSAGPVTDAEALLPNVTFEDIEAAARQVTVDASLQDVDALMSAATGLNALLRDAAQGMTQDQINHRFGELIDLARMGYGDSPPSWITSDPSLTQSLASLIGDYQEKRRQQSRPNSSPPSPSSGDASTNDMANTEGSGTLTGPQDAQASSPVAGPTLPGMPTDEQEAGLEIAQGAPVGASTQSGTGGGDMAGSGSQPLEASSLVGESRPGTEMLLEAAEYDTGSRIKVDMTLAPGPAQELEVQAGAEGLSGNSAAAGMQLDREFVQAIDRLAASRYFTPAETGEGALRR